MSKKALPPVHPGETLLEDLMKPLGLSQNKLAEALGVDPRRINEIVTGRRSITGDTALRLARYFGTSPEFWMNLQARYDLEVAKDKKLAEIQRKVKPRTCNTERCCCVTRLSHGLSESRYSESRSSEKNASISSVFRQSGLSYKLFLKILP